MGKKVLIKYLLYSIWRLRGITSGAGIFQNKSVGAIQVNTAKSHRIELVNLIL